MNKNAASGAIARNGEGDYRVSGQLVFGTVRDVLNASTAMFEKENKVSVDLSGVDGVDSAGLALLIEWYCAAHKSNRAIRFTGVSPQLRALAKISDIEDLLPFD